MCLFMSTLCRVSSVFSFSFFFTSFIYLFLCIASSVLVDNVVAYLFKLSVQLFMAPLGIDKFKPKFVLHTVYRKLNINKTNYSNDTKKKVPQIP